MSKYSFKKSERLKKERDFQRVLKQGKRLSNTVMAVYTLPNSLEYTRLGIIVSKKRARNACVRNRLKRLVHEAFRLNKDNFPKGVDMIVNLKQVESINLAGVIESLLNLINVSKTN